MKYKCGSKSEIKKFNAQPEINKIKINKKVLAEKSNKNNKQKKNLDISQLFNNKLYKGKNKQRNRKLEFYSSKNKNKAKYNSFAENKEKLTTTEKELYIEKKFNIQKEKSEIITFSQDSNNKKTLSEIIINPQSLFHIQLSQLSKLFCLRSLCSSREKLSES